MRCRILITPASLRNDNPPIAEAAKDGTHYVAEMGDVFATIAWDPLRKGWYPRPALAFPYGVTWVKANQPTGFTDPDDLASQHPMSEAMMDGTKYLVPAGEITAVVVWDNAREGWFPHPLLAAPYGIRWWKANQPTTFFGEAPIAPPPPPPPVPTPGKPHITAATAAGANGTADPGNSITLTANAAALGTTAIASLSGAWAITFSTQAAGTYSLIATAMNTPGLTAASDPFTLTVAAPPVDPIPNKPVITSLVQGQATGTSDPSMTIQLSGPSGVIGSATATSGGRWTITFQALPPGTYSLTATATDSSFVSSAASDPFSLTVAASPPPVPIPTITIAGWSTRSYTGDGTTAVTFAIPSGGPYIGNFDGPFKNTDGSAWLQDTHASGAVVTLINCATLRIGMTAGNPSGTLYDLATLQPKPAPGPPTDPTPPSSSPATALAPSVTINALTTSTGIIATFLASGGNPNSYTYALSGADAGLFTLNTSSGALSIPSALSVALYNVTITATNSIASVSFPRHVQINLPTAAGDIVNVTEFGDPNGSFTVTGNGNTVVNFQFTTVSGPFIDWVNKVPDFAQADYPQPELFKNTDGSVYVKDERLTGIVVTMYNCLACTVGGVRLNVSDAVNPTYLPDLPAPQTGAGLSSSNMAAIVTYASDGSTEIFNEADGTDLGDYTNPFSGVGHKNIKVRGRRNLNLIFRRENSGGRQEIRFEYGNPFLPNPGDLGAVSVAIYSGGSLVTTATCSNHFWLSAWVWASAERAILKTNTQLINAANAADRWVLPMDSSASIVAVGAAPAYVPMGFSDVHLGMPDTGGRIDIGVYHQRAAYFIATGDATARASTIEWGKCQRTVPIGVTDPWTNAPISYTKFPSVSWVPSRPQESTPAVPGYTGATSAGLEIEFCHYPELPYVAFALTGDVNYLQDAQNSMTVHIQNTVSHTQLWYTDGARCWAWSCRQHANVCRMMRDMTAPLPSFLLPYSYWKALLDKNRDAFTANYVTNPDPRTATMRMATDYTVAEKFWSEDYLVCTLAHLVWIGFSDWRPAFEWKIGSNIARTNGTSGWDRGYASAYLIQLYHQVPGHESDPFSLDYTNPILNFADLFARTGGTPTAGTALVNPGDGNIGSDRTYTAWCRGSLALGVLLGVTGRNSEVAACFAWLDPQARAYMTASEMDRQMAFASHT